MSVRLALLLAFVPHVRAAPAKPRELPGQALELKAADGWALKARYKAAKPGQKTFVLLHGKGQTKEHWNRLARGLARSGYGYVAPDLRGHGESVLAPDGQPLPWRKFKATKADNDYERIALDVQAAVDALVKEGVAEDSIGIIGDDVGGSVGLKYAAVHPKVPMVVLLSPALNYEEVQAVNAMRAYKARPILMIYSQLDRNASNSAPVLYSFARISAGERNATLIAVPDRHGVRLLNNDMVRQVVDWIGNPVRPEVGASSATLSGSSSSTAPAFGKDDDLWLEDDK